MAELESSWLKDGVIEIERLARAAAIVEPKVIALPLEPEGTYGIVTPGPAGAAHPIDVRVSGPDWHDETLDDPNQLIAFIQSMGERGVDPAKGAVYIGEAEIVYVYDFEDRRNVATCPLKVSEPWTWLATPQKPLTQREIIRVLRITFDGCLGRDSNLLSILRNIRWKEDGNLESNLQRGKEALGRQIMREVTGVSDFPEEFTLETRVYQNVRQDVTVRVALEILPDVERFEVIPFPNQIHSGLAETLEWLRSDIAEQTKTPTFIGAT